jgi:tRNA 2-thiouridine synthesizing protein A
MTVSKNYAQRIDDTIDITGYICPMTFVRTKLKLEQMSPGQVLDVRLKGQEPLENVPRSALQHGHRVLEIYAENEDASSTPVHHVLIQKAESA